MSQPSYRTSTLSQLALLTVCAYLGGALYVLVNQFPGDFLEPLKWAASVFGASYLTARGTESKNAQ